VQYRTRSGADSLPDSLIKLDPEQLKQTEATLSTMKVQLEQLLRAGKTAAAQARLLIHDSQLVLDAVKSQGITRLVAARHPLASEHYEDCEAGQDHALPRSSATDVRTWLSGLHRAEGERDVREQFADEGVVNGAASSIASLRPHVFRITDSALSLR
jgi:hypothetical protein